MILRILRIGLVLLMVLPIWGCPSDEEAQNKGPEFCDGGSEPNASGDCVGGNDPDGGLSGGDDSGGNDSSGNASCDNGTCEVGENCGNCVADCGECTEPVRQASSFHRVFYIGHSLVGRFIPSQLSRIAASEPEVSHDSLDQRQAGAELQDNWEDHTSGGADPLVELRKTFDEAAGQVSSNGFDILVLTPQSPINQEFPQDGRYIHARYFLEYAMGVCEPSWENYQNTTCPSADNCSCDPLAPGEQGRWGNPQIQAYVYQTWPPIDDPAKLPRPDRADDVIAAWGPGGTWESAIDNDLSILEQLACRLTATSDGLPVRILPAGKAMQLLASEIDAGNVSGLTSIEELYDDWIHLTETGFYFAALVHYATFYYRDPDGLDATGVDAALAADMQRIAWDAVRQYQQPRCD